MGCPFPLLDQLQARQLGGFRVERRSVFALRLVTCLFDQAVRKAGRRARENAQRLPDCFVRLDHPFLGPQQRFDDGRDVLARGAGIVLGRHPLITFQCRRTIVSTFYKITDKQSRWHPHCTSCTKPLFTRSIPTSSGQPRRRKRCSSERPGPSSSISGAMPTTMPVSFLMGTATNGRPTLRGR